MELCWLLEETSEEIQVPVIYMYLFNPSTMMWVEAGQLQIDRLRCACAVLPSSEIFIAGGASRTARPRAFGEQLQREVHIAALQ